MSTETKTTCDGCGVLRTDKQFTAWMCVLRGEAPNRRYTDICPGCWDVLMTKLDEIKAGPR